MSAQHLFPPIRELAEEVRAKRTSALDQARTALNAIRRADFGAEGLNAFISYDAARAEAAAAAVDAAVAAGGDGLALAGVPVAIKDNICTLDLPTTCGSRILEGYRSPYDATVVRRLRAAGAVVVGKTNLDEFAMGSSTENSAFGPTRNPFDLARVPGGSSGGSAAAVAAGVVPAALGSDTGGSVRQPAALCGVVGIKPTYGRVSRYGLVAFASSLDQVGTFGRTVADAAALLEVISGPDPLDSTCADRAVPAFGRELERDAQGLVVGVPKEYFPPELDGRIARLCREALERLRAAGATVREISLPHTRYAIPTYYIIAPAEASSNLARYDGVRYGLRAPGADATLAVYEVTRSLGFGAEVKRRIMLGTYALSAGYYEQYYGRAQRVRALIAQDFRRAFQDGVDVIFTPTTPSVAFRIGEKTEDPYQMYLADIFTVTANLAAVPGLSLPIGRVDGLPVGAQVLADRWNEAGMIRAAAALERALRGAP
ncbi:MAG: Asp-tRNA(Asn)/Glu-tRNA(Gln) amidotransferase subunit GatA [Gemmatimonadetes bacterium]|nr:Asp-tRNA(Asn)/Glu-tRNA(Gln) amidotransferase subunit GatA [Gemmatimonadota bacterium]